MATILLVEERPDLETHEATILMAAGHVVFRCGGGSSPLVACQMLRAGSCPLPDVADLIVYSGMPSAPMRNRSYRGRDLLRAYRRHLVYGSMPMLVVSSEKIDCLEGTGPLARVDLFSSPTAILGAVDVLLSHARLDHHAKRVVPGECAS